MASGTHVRHLKIDKEAFGAAFGHDPIAIDHDLLDSPLLTLDALGDLAEALPSEEVEHNVGDLPDIVSGGEGIERADMPPGEIARTIETNGLWMVLKRIERIPEYKRLLDETLDEVEPFVADREGGMTQREGFVFMSAPGSTTPSHTDPEHNILLQVRGWKEMTVGYFPDEETRMLEMEDHLGGGHRNIDWKPVDPHTFRMDPGVAVYVPPHAPHMVKNGDTGSVSLSITWRTPELERVARVSSVNARMRKLGLSPKAPGNRPGADKLKAGASKALGRLKRRP
jgi:hypothetical protein